MEAVNPGPPERSDHSVHAANVGDFELTLTVSRVAERHAAYVASQLFTLQRLFKLDGSDVETSISARRSGDAVGLERIYELVPTDSMPGPFPFPDPRS